MTTDFDGLFELDGVRAVSRASDATEAFCESGEIFDRIFSDYFNTPVHSGINSNADELSKVSRGGKASTGAVWASGSATARVVPSVILRDPLGRFDESGMEKLLKAQPSQLSADHLYANPIFQQPWIW